MKELAPTKYLLGGYTLDLAARELRHAGEPVPLTSLPFRVLVYLVENRDRVVTRAELLDTFWEGRDVYDNTLHNCVGSIRKALDDSLASPRFVETRHREGYRYVGPFEELAPEPATVVVERARGVSVVIEREPAIAKRSGVELRPAATAAVALALFACFVAGLVVERGLRSQATAITPRQPALRSIAVLPLEELASDGGKAPLGDGVVESLIGDLAAINNLKVISRGSVFAFRGAHADPCDVGRKLGVETVLEGSIRRTGDAIRVDVRLVSTEDGRVLWAGDATERTTSDLFDAEAALACRLGAELRTSLCGQSEQVARRYTRNVAAYREYVKGRYHWNRRSRLDLQQAIEHFDAAVAIDPSYAPAYAGLAETYAVMGVNGIATADACVPLGEANAKKALELDATLANAWAALGLLRNGVYEWAEGERLLTRALDLNPEHGPARFWYAHSLMVRGRFDEAEVQLLHARASDPLSYPIASGLAELYYHWRKFDRAVELANAAAAIDPNRRSAYWTMATSYLALGMTAEAPYSVACVYARMGEVEEATRWLRRAYEIREADLAKIAIAPELDPIRSDPRYEELVRLVGVDAGNEFTTGKGVAPGATPAAWKPAARATPSLSALPTRR
jgi:TolB-like protein/DNA-binding winged helix-turn-helix (wHTH) protein